MIGPRLRRHRWMALLAVHVASLFFATSARAQFGGFLIPLGPNVPSPVENINARSLQAGAAAYAARSADHSPYRGNPNSYLNVGRQARMAQAAQGVTHFNTATRRPTPEHLVGRERVSSIGLASSAAAPEPPRPTAPAPAAVAEAPARPPMELAAFFDADETLVWPADAPVTGDLGARRQDSDAAALAVLNEVQAHGTSSIESAADARARLLDYGRPALQYLRDSRSTAVAENFHSFLLSLYDALGRAAISPPSG